LNDIIENKNCKRSRCFACVLCIPTVAIMFFDWITIIAIDKLKLSLSFLGILDSDYTLLQIFDFMKKLEKYIEPNTKRLIIATGVIEILSILSISVLFIVLLIGIPNLIKAFSVTSFVFCSSMFFIFISSVHIINSNVSEVLNVEVTQLVQATPWPYVMLVCASVLIFVSVFHASLNCQYNDK